MFDVIPVKKTRDATDTRPEGTRNISYADYTLNISLKNVNFGSLETIEPYFVSLTLYDLAKRIPISEPFFCSPSDRALISKLNGRPVSFK